MSFRVTKRLLTICYNTDVVSQRNVNVSVRKKIYEDIRLCRLNMSKVYSNDCKLTVRENFNARNPTIIKSENHFNSDLGSSAQSVELN